MVEQRSFTEYIKKRFDNDFWLASEIFLRDNLDSFNIEVRRIHRAGETEISDVKVEHVWVEDKPGMEIHFDVAVSIWFETHEGDYHYDDYDENIIWIMIHCRGDLDKNLDDFEILQVSRYDGKNLVRNPMDDSLVPVMNKNQLDDIAEQFLREHYKKALLEPMWIDPTELAAGMGLTIRYENITKDGSIFGRSFFYDCETELYDEDADAMYKVTIPAKTILVDKKAAFLMVLGATNNTIVHECVHWDKHKKAFALARLYDNELSNIGCRVVGGIAGNKRDAIEWMEWQANALAPRIQMPITMFKKKVNQLISKYRKETHAYDMIDIIEPIIDELVLTFGVSRLAAKIRMMDAGYEEAAGAFIFVDGKYVKPHKASKGFLAPNQTFSISARDAIVESKFNTALAAVIADNEYIFVDSHFVLNTPLYVEKDLFGNTSLTHYARNHMDECCLVFNLTMKTSVSEHYHTECFLNRDKSSEITFEAHYSAKSKNAANQVQMIKDYNADLLAIARKLPMNFSGALDALIGWSEMTEEELAEAADMSEKTIQRLRNSEPDNVSIETVVQLCIGMKLPPVLSGCLIRASGKNFMMTEQHIMYQFLLNSCYHMSINECNDMLIAQNLKPLGKLNRVS
ncbi:helix-turn-helix domain-containing protein [Oscillospiraceae bacterium LCP25S3_F9]